MTPPGLLQVMVTAQLALLAGCDGVFGLVAPPLVADAATDAPPYETCGVALGGDPLRYAMISNPRTELAPDGGVVSLPWAWSEARTMCRQRGMDLAVFNDAHELGTASEPPGWPYWIGEYVDGVRWSSVDVCPALMTDEPTTTADACGVVAAPGALAPIACTGALPAPAEPGVVVAALCETPRPTEERCLGNNPQRTSYPRSREPMSRDAARAYCAGLGGDLVVIESHAEWLHVAALTAEVIQARFWIGSTFDGETWTASTGCPAVYVWTGGTPGTPGAGSCLASALRPSTDEDDPGGIVVDGVEPTACTDAADVFALCEVR